VPARRYIRWRRRQSAAPRDDAPEQRKMIQVTTSERDEEDVVQRVQLGRRIDKMVHAEMFDGWMHQRQRLEEAGSKLRWPGS
jgi:hypothetical protein